MEKSSYNPENIKKYTSLVSDIIDDNKKVSKKEILKLQNEFKLNDNDIKKVTSLSLAFFEDAKVNFEIGNWDKAITNIKEAIYKDPLNLDFYDLYFLINKQSLEFLGEEKPEDNNFLGILSITKFLNKKKYRNYVKELNKKSLKKFNKMWLLTLFLLIPVFLIIKNSDKKNIITNIETTKTILKPGEILVETKILKHPSQVKIKILNSKLESSKNSFFYNLNFYIKSEISNITKIEGKIIWYDLNNNIIYSEPFKSPNNTEYFMNEMIPISFNKSSRRDSPSINKIIIEVTKIESLTGKERGNTNPIEVLLPKGILWDFKLDQSLFLITEGVVTSYFTIDMILRNNEFKDIKILNGFIEWIDDYNIVKYSKEMNIITEFDIPVDNMNPRIIHKTIEIENITEKFRFKVKELK